LWLLLGTVLAFAAFATVVVVRSRAATVSGGTARFLVAVSGWFSILLTILIVGSLAAQRGLEDARDAPEVNTLLGLAFLIATVIAVGLWFLAPRAREIEPEPVPEAEPLPLAASERVHWSGEARPARIVVGIAGVALVVTA